jgi:hypothetical protein
MLKVFQIKTLSILSFYLVLSTIIPNTQSAKSRRQNLSELISCKNNLGSLLPDPESLPAPVEVVADVQEDDVGKVLPGISLIRLKIFSSKKWGKALQLRNAISYFFLLAPYLCMNVSIYVHR